MTLLSAEGVRKEFGGLTAVDGVDLSLDRGEMVGLIGPNGAGKTTLFDCLSGIHDVDGGRIRFDGVDVTDEPPHDRARRGMVRTFQQTRELTTMTVADNVKLPAANHPGERTLPALVGTDGARSREREVEERAEELLSFFDLADHADDYAATLSGGQRKLLEFARALMLDPEVLLLDEPLAGINPTLETSIVEYVRRLNDDGMAFLVVEHEIETLADLVERIVVLDRGEVIASGPPERVLDDDRVIDAYLGGRA